MICRVLFIPGAWSTSNCFNYYAAEIDRWEGRIPHWIQYNIQSQSMPSVVGATHKQLDQMDHPILLVGHSLGGMIAMACHDHPMVAGILTVASPIDGLDLSRFIQTIVTVRSPFLVDAMRRSTWVRDMHAAQYTKPIVHIATKGGFHPAMYEENDGVVSYASQTRWKAPGAIVKTLVSTHHDILQDDAATNILQQMMHGGLPREDGRE